MIKLTVAAGLGALVLAVSACGLPGAAAAKSSPTPNDYQQALLFSQCMRAHGVPDYPDPQISSSGSGVSASVTVRVGGGSLNASSPQFQAALTACERFLPIKPGSGPSAQDRQAMLNFASCMRTHGIPDFPDPPGSGQQGPIDQLPADVDPRSPQFQAAVQACMSMLPRGTVISRSGQ